MAPDLHRQRGADLGDAGFDQGHRQRLSQRGGEGPGGDRADRTVAVEDLAPLASDPLPRQAEPDARLAGIGLESPEYLAADEISLRQLDGPAHSRGVGVDVLRQLM